MQLATSQLRLYDFNPQPFLGWGFFWCVGDGDGKNESDDLVPIGPEQNAILCYFTPNFAILYHLIPFYTILSNRRKKGEILPSPSQY